MKWLGSTVFTGTSRIDRFKICLSLPITSFRAFYTLMKDSQDEWLAEGISTTVARHLKDAGYSDISEAFYVATHQTPAPPVTITLTLIIHSFILCSASFVCMHVVVTTIPTTINASCVFVVIVVVVFYNLRSA